jgi:transcriptional regulator with XRE-family HTH domain
MADFPQRLRELRSGAGLTQTEFGALFNLSKQTISGYEKGDNAPPIETLEKLADYFKVSTDYLLGRSSIKNNPVTIAASRSDDRMDDLPEQALKEIEQFKEFVRAKYIKK